MLDKTGTYKFTEENVGYGEQKPAAVKVINSGTGETGNLTVEFSGRDKNCFTLSKDSLDSIAAGRTGNFTIVPKTGLAEGTYTATVTVGGDSVEKQSFDVSFTVKQAAAEPTYGISLDRSGTETFTGVSVGYEEQNPKRITVTNTGTEATGSLIVLLSGDDKDCFTLS